MVEPLAGRNVRARITELDGIRGLAIAAILACHYIYIPLGAPAEGSALWYLSRALCVTWAGVDLFFVLSGFLITRVLVDHLHAENYFRAFYVRRACRILPIYAVLLLTYLVMIHFEFIGSSFQWLSSGALPLWSYATFSQNILMAQKAALGCQWLAATWSLAVEEQFYLVFPLLIYFLPQSKWVPTAAAMIALATLLRLALPGVAGYVLMPTRADALFTGVLVALAVRNPAAMLFFKKHRRWLYAAFFVLLLSGALLTCRGTILARGNFTRVAMLCGALLLVVATDPQGLAARLFCQPWLVGLGRISYGVYLFHQPLSGLLHGLDHGGPPSLSGPAGPLMTLAALALTVVVSTAMYWTIEKWFIALGHRYRFRMPLSSDSLPVQRRRRSDYPNGRSRRTSPCAPRHSPWSVTGTSYSETKRPSSPTLRGRRGPA